MEIELKEITIRELTDAYVDNAEKGVRGYGGRLDIRPPYQREFIYKDAQRDAVIDSIRKGYPLNTMYWSVRRDGNFEIIDGQQRTVSICQYVNGDFSFEGRYFHNLQDDEQAVLLNYDLMIYCCEGTDSERLAWFEVINIAGEKLTNQELRNAVYAGSWLTDAKRYFSKTGGPAYEIARDYIKGVANRQEYLEQAIAWISESSIEAYMAEHQNDQNANELWLYFNSVIEWVGVTFTKRRSFMKGVDWGALYKDFKEVKLDTEALEAEIAELVQDDDVTKKSGIYPYVLRRDEKYLNIRAFTDSMRQAAYERQAGVCVLCSEAFTVNAMEADHITPWSEGGATHRENCQMLCRECNRRKSNR